MQTVPIFTLVVILFGIFILAANAIRILREYERGAFSGLGRLITGEVKGPA
jgi:hypothetical protein